MKSKEIRMKTADLDPLRTTTDTPQGAHTSPQVSSAHHFPHSLIQGECLLFRQLGSPSGELVHCQVLMVPAFPALCRLTNYRVSVLPLDKEWFFVNKVQEDFFEVPLALIQRLNVAQNTVEIITKDNRLIRLAFDAEVQSNFNLLTVLRSYTFPQSLCSRFTFKHKYEGLIDGWGLYNVHAEMARLGLSLAPDSPFTFLDNSSFNVCRTYPPLFVVPSALSVQQVIACAGFRARNRLPALVWRNHLYSSSLWRSSQPKTGIRIARCPADELYLSVLARTSPQTRKLHIYDARPFMNAHAQRAIGGGVESKSHYEDIELRFLKIANVDCLRDAWLGMFSAYTEPPVKFYSAVEKSG